MIRNIAFLPCLVLIAVTATSCGFTHSKSDVARYLGKTENEIVDILGTPTGWCGGPAEASAGDAVTPATPPPPRRIMYRVETVSLPKPLTGVDFVLSDEGLCRAVAGYTGGFDSPEDLLAEVGIGRETLNRLDEDDSAIRFEAPDLSSVEVYKPNRVAEQYADFLVVG